MEWEKEQLFQQILKIFEKFTLLASRSAPFRTSKDPYWKKYYVSGEGYNYLMPHLLGSVARVKLKDLKKNLSKKIKVGKIYINELKKNNLNYGQQISDKSNQFIG